MRALHHFEGFRASCETPLSKLWKLPNLEAKHLEHAEAGQTDDDQVNRDDEIQEPRRNQDQNSRKQGDDGGNVRRTNGHRNISG